MGFGFSSVLYWLLITFCSFVLAETSSSGAPSFNSSRPATSAAPAAAAAPARNLRRFRKVRRGVISEEGISSGFLMSISAPTILPRYGKSLLNGIHQTSKLLQ